MIHEEEKIHHNPHSEELIHTIVKSNKHDFSEENSFRSNKLYLSTSIRKKKHDSKVPIVKKAGIQR